MAYTYEVDGVSVTAPPSAAPSDLLLHATLGVAAVLSFRHSRPVVVRFQGQPYRVVEVRMADTATR